MSEELENRIAELREKHAIVHPTPFIAQFCGIDPLSGHCRSCIEPGSKDEDGDYSFAEWPCDVIKALDLLASLRARPQESQVPKMNVILPEPMRDNFESKKHFEKRVREHYARNGQEPPEAFGFAAPFGPQESGLVREIREVCQPLVGQLLPASHLAERILQILSAPSGPLSDPDYDSDIAIGETAADLRRQFLNEAL